MLAQKKEIYQELKQSSEMLLKAVRELKRELLMRAELDSETNNLLVEIEGKVLHTKNNLNGLGSPSTKANHMLYLFKTHNMFVDAVNNEKRKHSVDKEWPKFAREENHGH